ncbi:peptidase G2 autoproteolytic cleavage domain-containing protein [Rummeliibacillus sp. NPDC094406]|uniref:peptidase G2 autoproteolytic cleavage domain-containing protein n=1 Tax=Rummeliibacillus sp. NPDC094406 TaxID=3364511 RepID=UPI0037F7395F
MAEHFSFFDPVLNEDGTYDREYNAQEFTDYFGALVTTGVMKGVWNQLSVSADGASMQVKLNTGVAFVEAHYYKNDSLLTHVLDTEVVGKDRIDRIVIRLDLSTEARHVKSFVKKGVASASPVPPVLAQTPNLYEISVAQVKVVGGQTFISASNVIDERGNDVICPWAGSKILPNFNNDAMAEHVSNTLLHKQGIGNIQIGANANAEGVNTIAVFGWSYKIEYVNDTTKTVTLTTVENLAVGDLVMIKNYGAVLVKDIKIKAINGLNVTLETNEQLASLRQFVLIKQRQDFTSSYSMHAEGMNSVSTGYGSHAEGVSSIATGNASHAEGSNTVASGPSSHVEGTVTIASGDSAHAEGYQTVASGLYSHAEGDQTVASGGWSHAGGSKSVASANSAFAMGYATRANVNYGMAFGQVNKDMAVTDALVIGNGETPLGSRNASNAFRVTTLGAVYGKAAYNSTGADYAEYFEWLDGNVDAEERQGFFVTMDGDKIRKATSDDDYILGIISVNPSVVGDSHQDAWNSQYVTDEWGRIQFRYVDIPDMVDSDGKVIWEAHQEYRPISNPEHNYDEEYIPREQRPEWSPVGIVGKLLVRDDGTCGVNGFCKPNDEGIATSSTDGYRVMKRVSENIVQVFIK